MFSRLGTVLTQASTLTGASAAAAFWLVTHPAVPRPLWTSLATVFAVLLWTASGALAVLGMRGAKLGAVGIDPREGYRQNVLGQDIRDMQLWVIKSHGLTLEAGHAASNRVRRYLNWAIALLIAAPIMSCVLAISASHYFEPSSRRVLSFLTASML